MRTIWRFSNRSSPASLYAIQAFRTIVGVQIMIKPVFSCWPNPFELAIESYLNKKMVGVVLSLKLSLIEFNALRMTFSVRVIGL